MRFLDELNEHSLAWRFFEWMGFEGQNLLHLGGWFFKMPPFGAHQHSFHQAIGEGFAKSAKGRPVQTFICAYLSVMLRQLKWLIHKYSFWVEWQYRKSFDTSIHYQPSHANLLEHHLLNSAFETLVKEVEYRFMHQPTFWQLICRWVNVIRHGRKYRSQSEFDREMRCVWWSLDRNNHMARMLSIVTLQLYVWWVFDRPNRVDPHEELHEYDEQVFEAHGGQNVPSNYYVKVAKLRAKIAILNDQYDEEDKLMLARLQQLGKHI